MDKYLAKVRKFIFLYLLIPGVMDLIIESLNRKSVFSAFRYVIDKPYLFLFNVLIIMLTMSIAMFFKREVFVYSVIGIIWLLFGIANFIILHFRVTPFSAVDFSLISSAISVSGHYLSVMNIAMLIVGVLMLIVAIICLFRVAPCHSESIRKQDFIISGGIVIVLAIMTLFIRNSSTSVQALANDYTNISDAYENYGFVYCFTNSIIDTGIKKPDDYSQESVSKIVSKLEDTEDTTGNKPNIVMIQLESFFDVNNVKGLKFSKDPLPNFHKIQNDFTNGLLTVPTVGAGTVNTEFEILTGMRQHDFGVSEYPYKTVMKRSTTESVCNDLAEIGYTSHCVHNNTATFYGRNTVFSNMGFDNFTSIEYMNDVTLNPNGWANDNIITDEVMKTLHSTKNQDFTFGITVQSHGKYDGIALPNPEIQVTGAPQGKEDAYTYYVNEIYQVDQMIGELVDRLSALNEDTVLVLYGDHLPSLDLTKDDLKNHDLYQTQYVVWNNFGLEEKDQDLTSYQLYSTVLDQIGIHEGTITKYQQQTKWTDEAYLTGLKTLEYDLLYGDNYAYNGENPFVVSNLQMGTKPVTISDVKREGDHYIVSGTGFTSYAKVKWNGTELDTQWLDENHLKVEGDIECSEKEQTKAEMREADPEDVVNAFVVQVQNGDGLELSTTKPLLWKDTSLHQ